MASAVWQEIQRLLGEGETPVIKVSPSAEVKAKWNKKIGKVRMRALRVEYGYVMCSPSGHPLKCRAGGCQTFLRKYQADIVCSESCRQSLMEECETLLGILKGYLPAQGLPPHLRVREARGRRQRKVYYALKGIDMNQAKTKTHENRRRISECH